jgi:hypothetical protein
VAEYWLQLATANGHWELLSVASCCNHKAIDKYSELSHVSGNAARQQNTVPDGETDDIFQYSVFCLCHVASTFCFIVGV